MQKKNSNTAILIPSFHGKNTLERPKDFDKSLVEILRNINGNVCLENDPKEITEQFSIPVSSYRLSLFNDGYAASGYFPKNNDVTSRLIHKLDLPREVEERYLRLGTPIDLQQRILNNILSIYQKSEQPAIDDVIRSSAIMFGRKVNYLESVDHVSTMMLTSLEDRDLWRNALTRLSDLLNCETCREKYVDLIRKFEEQLFDGQLNDAINTYTLAVKISGEDILVLDALGSRRNPYIALQIERRLMSNQCSVFAIGASHFGGINTLQSNLKYLGFYLKVVAIGENEIF